MTNDTRNKIIDAINTVGAIFIVVCVVGSLIVTAWWLVKDVLN